MYFYQCKAIKEKEKEKTEYSLRESVSAQGREDRGFDSQGEKKKAIFYLVIRKSR
jgi:hypothetical protein